MAKKFNPYFQWLGIRSKGPPDHYQLLGLTTFESNIGVIKQAAQRQCATISQYTDGPDIRIARALMRQVEAARDVLSSPATKQEYDATLRGKPNAAKRSPKPTGEPVVGTIISEEEYARSRQPRLPTLSSADIKAYSQLRVHSKAIGGLLLLGCLSAALIFCTFVATVVLPNLAPDNSSGNSNRSNFGNHSMHDLHIDSAEQLAEEMRAMRGRRSIDDMKFDHEQFDKQFDRDLNDQFGGIGKSNRELIKQAEEERDAILEEFARPGPLFDDSPDIDGDESLTDIFKDRPGVFSARSHADIQKELQQREAERQRRMAKSRKEMQETMRRATDFSEDLSSRFGGGMSFGPPMPFGSDEPLDSDEHVDTEKPLDSETPIEPKEPIERFLPLAPDSPFAPEEEPSSTTSEHETSKRSDNTSNTRVSKPGPHPRKPIAETSEFVVRINDLGCIKLNGTERLIDPGKERTVELWFRAKVEKFGGCPLISNAYRDENDVRIRYGVHFCLNDKGDYIFQYKDGYTTDRGLAPEPRWYHLAMTTDEQQIKLYLDGKPILDDTTTIPSNWRPSEVGLYIGNNPDIRSTWNVRDYVVDIRDYRVSDGVRYTSQFNPPARFENDDDTLLLLDFSVGKGNTIRDLSGNRYHAELNGGTWVKIKQ